MFEAEARTAGAYEQRVQINQSDAATMAVCSHWPRPMLVTKDGCELASEIAFYRTRFPHEAGASNDTTDRWILGGDGRAYRYWMAKHRWLGRDFVYVGDKRQMLRKAEAHFRSV